MDMAAFCARYKLKKTIKDKFLENGYEDARILRFVTLVDMEAMKFLRGEVASVRDAVEKWST